MSRHSPKEIERCKRIASKMVVETGEAKARSLERHVRPRYYAKEYARGRWHVIGPDGIPIYDGAPSGNDKPVIFRDEDAALACAERCNIDDDGQEPNKSSPENG